MSWSYEPRPGDQFDWPLPFHQAERAKLAAAGGASTQSAAQAMAGRMRTALAYTVADGRALFRPHDAAGGWRVLDGHELSLWAAGALGQLEHLTAKQWSEVADSVRTWVLGEHARAQAQRPASRRGADEAIASQRQRDLAELDRQAEEIAARRAALARIES